MIDTETFSNFKGLYTAADKYSTPGSPDTQNCDIDFNNNITKSKGYTAVTASVATVTNIIASTDTVLVCSNTIPASGTVIVYDCTNASCTAVLEGRAWQVKAATTTSIVLASAITTGLSRDLQKDIKTYTLFNEITNSGVVTNSGVWYNYPIEVNGNLKSYASYASNPLISYIEFNGSAISARETIISLWLKCDGSATDHIFIDSVSHGTTYVEFLASGGNLLFRIYSTGALQGTLTVPLVTTTTNNYVIFISKNATLTGAKTMMIFKNGTLIDSNSNVLLIPATYSADAQLAQGNYMYDFSLLNLTNLQALYTEASIASYIYNNNATLPYKYINEYTGFGAKLDLKMQYLRGFAPAGGVAL